MDIDLDTSIGFLQTLRPGGPWNLCSIAPDGPIASATFHDPEQARAWLRKHAKSNLHFTPNPSSQPTGKGGRSTKDTLDRIEFVHVDIDVDKLKDARSQDDRKAAALERLEVADSAPTLVTDSGGGLQALWRLEPPLPPTPENIDQAEGVNRWLIQEYGGDSSTLDVSRLLRLPGTVNYPDARKRKRGRVVAPTKLLRSTGEVFEPWHFGHVPAKPKASVDVEFGAPEDVDFDALIPEHDLDDRLVTIIRDGRLDTPKSGDDSNSAWLFDAACNLLRAGVVPEQVLGLLLDPELGISSSVLSPAKRPTPEQQLAYAERQVRNGLAHVRAEREADHRLLRDEPPSEQARPLSSDEERIGRLTLVHADRVEMKPLNPLWPGRIYVGKLTTLAGVPDQGKSMVTCDIAARVSRGLAWPDGSGFAPNGTAIFLAAEDDKADTIVPRLAAAGADLTKVKILNSLVISHRDKKAQRTFNIAEDIAELTTLVRRYPDTRVLFIDPTNAFMGTSKENDSFRDSDVRAVLGPLKEWAEQHEVAVVLVTHFKKGGTGRALDQVMGSLAFVALARSSWAFLEEKDAEGEPTGRKLLAKIKQNITAPVDALACHIEGVELSNGLTAPRIVWEDAVEGNADMIMSGGTGGQKLAAAKAFLLAMLSEGPVKAAEVLAAADRSGIAEKTLNRAKKLMGVESVQRDGAWHWEVGETELPAM